jgi:hypothetical protein
MQRRCGRRTSTECTASCSARATHSTIDRRGCRCARRTGRRRWRRRKRKRRGSRARRPEGPGNAPGKVNESCDATTEQRRVPSNATTVEQPAAGTRQARRASRAGPGRARPLDLRGRGQERTLPICLGAEVRPPRTVQGPCSLRDAAHRHRIWQPWTTGSTPRKGPARSSGLGRKTTDPWLGAKRACCSSNASAATSRSRASA